MQINSQIIIPGIQSETKFTVIDVIRWRLIGQSQIQDFDQLKRIVGRGIYKLDQPASYLVEESSISLITLEERNTSQLKGAWKIGGHVFKIDLEASGSYTLHLDDKEHRNAAEQLIKSELTFELAHVFRFTKPANVRSITKKSSKNKLSLRSAPLDTIKLKSIVKNKETGKEETLSTTYSLHEALTLNVEFDDNNRLMVFLSSGYEVYTDQLIPQNRWGLPSEVREKWEKLWRQDGQSLIEKTAPYLSHISDWIESHGWVPREPMNFDSQQFLRLPAPRLVFNEQEIVLPQVEASDKFIFKSLKKFGPNLQTPESFKVLPVLPNPEAIRVRPPKYFNDWGDAMKQATRQVALRLTNGRYGLIKIPRVVVLEPIIKNDESLDKFYKKVRTCALANGVDAVLLMLERFDSSRVGGEHDIAKHHLKDLPSQGITLRTLLYHPPKGTSPISFLNTSASILAIGLVAKSKRQLLWNVKEEGVDMIIGLDVKKVLKGKYAYAVGVTIYDDKVLVDADGESLNKKSEKIPYDLLYERLYNLFERNGNPHKPFIKRFIIIRDGFNYDEEIQALKDVIDRLQLAGLINPGFEFAVLKIIKDLKSTSIRLIEPETLDNEKVRGQPTRGWAFLRYTKTLPNRAVIVTTGHPDIRVTVADSVGFSRPLGVELVYQSENFSLEFPQLLRILYWQTYQNVVSFRQTRIPIQINLAEAFLEYLVTYKLKLNQIPRGIWD